MPPRLSKWSFPASLVPPWCLAGCLISPFLPPWCLPGASHWSFPASLAPPKLSNQSFPASLVPPWCLPGCPISPFLPPWCFAGCPISPFLPPWCLPGCPNGRQGWSLFTREAARSHGKAMRKARKARKSHVECLGGSRETLFGLLALSMALGGLPGEQNQIWPWQITGVSWSCLGRLRVIRSWLP